MKILVTGGKGFIGSYLMPLLPKNTINWDLVDGNDIFDEKFESHLKQVETIIHLAALTNVEYSKSTPKPYYQTNVFGTARVTYLCNKYNKKLIFLSTNQIYNHEISPYAKTKYWADQIVKLISQFTPVVVLRIFNVFGIGMENNSGSIINLFLRNNPIAIYGDGMVTRDFIHVRDVASIIHASIDQSWNNSTVDVATGKQTTIREMAEIFAKYSHKSIVYKQGQKQLQWPPANIKTLTKLYKKKLTTNLEKDIKELCDEYHKQNSVFDHD